MELTTSVRAAVTVAAAACAVEWSAPAPAEARAPERLRFEPVLSASERVVPGSALGAPSVARPPSDLPLDHWAYPLLERLVARRVLEIELSTRPVARSAVAEALLSRSDAAEGSGDPSALTAREAWALDRLEAEFLGGRVDAPSVSLVRDGAVVALGVLLGTGIGYEEGCLADRDTLDVESPRSPGGEGGEPRATAEICYELWGGVGDDLGFYSDAGILLEGQEGPRITTLSNRARTWRGVAVSIDRAYVKLERPHLSVALGRRGPAWGRSTRGRLLVSGSAPTFDQIDGSLTVGPLRFYAFHALLEYAEVGTEQYLGPGDRVFLAAHRAVFAARRGSVGLSEVVVYSSGIPDPAYLNPLLPYYVSQHNERVDDNVLWSVDFTCRPVRGLEVYGEFLIDDLQYDRDADNPDKFALTVGQTYYSHAAGLDYEVVAEYSQARRWTYSHDRVEHRYVQDGRPIGFDLGPDADRALVEITAHPSPAWSVAVGYEHSRKGEGTLTEIHESGEADDGGFPSGRVLTTRRIALDVTHDDLAGFSYGLGAVYENRTGEGDASGDDDDGWEVWFGATFRI